MPSPLNTIEEETERRQAMLFADVLAVMNRFAGVEGRYVEIVHTGEIRLVSRYVTPDGKVHDITQAVTFNYAARERK